MTDIETLRRFNRSFTRAIGLLDRSYLNLGRSLAASRVLFEIGRPGADVRELRQRLGLDSGYLSRLLRALERERLVEIEAARNDRRVRHVRLTADGLAEVGVIDTLSDASAKSLLDRVRLSRREELVRAFRTLELLLGADEVSVRIVDVHDERAQRALGSYYAELAERFPGGFDPGDDATGEHFGATGGCFMLALLGNIAVGCGAIAIEDGFAEIKRMWVDVDYRGIGVATRLIEALEDEARRAGMRIVRLDTNGTLTEARALYGRSGYHEIDRYNDNPYADHWFEKSLAP